MENCPSCGEGYDLLGKHWSASSCDYPTFTARQHEILTGILLGDGSITNRCAGERKPFRTPRYGNPGFRVDMVTEEFLVWVADELGVHSNEVRRAENNEAKQDIYTLFIRQNPNLEEYASWYSSGKKQFSDDLELTPLTLKMWYVTDGHYLNERQPTISALNEIHRTNYLHSIFSDIGIDIRLGTNEIFIEKPYTAFFDYIGKAPPGFEYKFP